MPCERSVEHVLSWRPRHNANTQDTKHSETLAMHTFCCTRGLGRGFSLNTSWLCPVCQRLLSECVVRCICLEVILGAASSLATQRLCEQGRNALRLQALPGARTHLGRVVEDERRHFPIGTDAHVVVTLLLPTHVHLHLRKERSSEQCRLRLEAQGGGTRGQSRQ